MINLSHPLTSNESDTYRVLIARNLVMLETHRPENPTNKVPIEEVRRTLIRLSDVDRLNTDDRDLIDEALRRLTKLEVSVIAKMNR